MSLFGCKRVIRRRIVHLDVHLPAGTVAPESHGGIAPDAARIKQHLLSEDNRLRRFNLELSGDMRRKNQATYQKSEKKHQNDVT